MTNIKVSIVQKARYGVLFLPVLWVLFSGWVVINEISSDSSYTAVDALKTPPSILEILSFAYFLFWTVKIFINLWQALRKNKIVSAELKSGAAFMLGITLLTASNDFHLGQLLSYVGMAFTDLAAIVMIVTLFQGKPFGETTLYHKDIELRRV